MKKIMSILLSIVMSTSLVIPTFAEAPPYSIDKVATKVVIDQHELRDIYDKYASVTDESNGVQGVQTRLKRKDRFESK